MHTVSVWSVVQGGTLAIQDRIDEIVALLREAELDETKWPAASALIDDTCNLRGNDLLLAGAHPLGGLDIKLRWLLLRGEPRPELKRDYAENYAAIDERAAAILREPFGKLVHTTSLLSDEVRRQSVTYNEYLLPNAGENCLNVRMPATHDLQVAWSLVGPGGGHPSDWSTDQIDAIRQLLPHVRQFVRVRHALAEARADGMKTTALLDTRRIEMLLLDRHGWVVEANDRARTLLARGEGLSVRRGRLVGAPPADADGVAVLLDSACRERRSGSMPIIRHRHTPLVLYATPAAPTELPPPADRAVARILLAEPFAAPAVNPQRVAAALGLTPAQARVAAALAAGGSVASIAAATHRTPAAVRWHIREALTRLGLSRQLDLVRVVLSTPGVFDGRH
ncbi:MAG: hypothetical protein F4029_16900 [Gammaproteobacteria bacterium]|nr:hypothetical protein [Gammaproteobacteria bacterium]MYF31202.1 hypothetical protein [Gammaproteobacteria bacterium]MYK47897.1 hypothetical protein [Gammaproteobacteria bacterium]